MWKLKIKSGGLAFSDFPEFAGYFGLFFMLGVAMALLIGGCSSREIEVGEIKFKKVMGIKDGDKHMLLSHNQGEQAFIDPAYVEYFIPDSLNITVSDELYDRWLADFEDVRYLVGLELCKNEDLEEFKLGRDHFNKLRIMPDLIVKVEYETHKMSMCVS